MLFSIIVPIYKVEKYLEKCIESILNQTLKDFELILVDDGSPDRCPKMCDIYKQRDNRVKVLHKENGGLVSARNEGILMARGDYICYVDGDDWVANNFLEVVWNKVIKIENIDMVVFGATKVYEHHNESILSGPSEGVYDKELMEEKVYPYMMYDNRKPFCRGLVFPVAWNKVYRRELLLNHFCKDERIRMGEDNAFVFECLVAADRVAFIDDELYFYNQLNTNSMVHSYDALRFDNNKHLTDYISCRLGGQNEILDNQINAFKVYWLIMAVFHEIKCGRKILDARRHIAVKIKETDSLSGISCKGIPKSAQCFILLLKFRLYLVTLMLAKVVNHKRKM